MWVDVPARRAGGRVKIDPRTSVLVQRTAANGAYLAYWSSLTRASDGVWVTDQDNDTVLRIHDGTSSPNGTVRVGHGPAGILARGDSIWVAASLDGTIDEIDASTLRVVSRTRVGSSPQDLVAAGDGIWIAFAEGWLAPP